MLSRVIHANAFGHLFCVSSLRLRSNPFAIFFSRLLLDFPNETENIAQKFHDMTDATD